MLEGSINFIGEGKRTVTLEEGVSILAERKPHPNLEPDPNLPDDTRLWAALQSVSGGIWKGSVYDVDQIIKVLEAGKKALEVESNNFVVVQNIDH